MIRGMFFDPAGMMENNTMGSNMEKARAPSRLRRCSTLLFAGLAGLCILLMGISVISNLLMPSASQGADRLSKLDKARLTEAFHLRQTLGEALWTGWGEADIPMIVYNEETAFLVGYPDPPAGWVTVPERQMEGEVWEAVPADAFDGQTYYRQRLSDPEITPQAFVVLIGERWVASLLTREWMEINLGNDFKDNMPAIARPVLPYRLAARLFLSAAGDKDGYICSLLHESFHAYEGLRDPERLMAAERVFNQNQSRYPWDEEIFSTDWQRELDLLADAVQAPADETAIDLARQFLAQRAQRRKNARLDASLTDLERLKDWEEGLAKYTELSMWRLAGTTPGYLPLPGMEKDAGFKNYAGYARRWAQEIDQIRRMANDEGDTRFYYSGLGQAALLDRLMPDWRTKIMNRGVWLEDLLSAAVK
jgi:hypothetical protein